MPETEEKSHAESIGMRGSRGSLCTDHDVALLDLDGVVYLGEDAIPMAPRSLAAARRAGMRLAFVTNNASRTQQQIAAHLMTIGVPAVAEDVVTSAHAAARELAENLPIGAPVLVIGSTGLALAIAEQGLTPVFSASDEPLAVVQGFSPGLGWPDLCEGAIAIRRGLPWIATNLDSTLPTSRGLLPGNGSLVAALRQATGASPRATGKPDPRMHTETVLRSRARTPIVVGDRLDTDIEGARRADCPSLLVLSGVTTAEQLLGATPSQRPDYVGNDVTALLHSHPPVVQEGPRLTCGDVSVTISGDAMIVSGSDDSGDGLNELRVLAVACWRLADAGLARPTITWADHELPE